MDSRKDQTPEMDNPGFYIGTTDGSTPKQPCRAFSTESACSGGLRKRKRPLKESFVAYIMSQKGRELCMGTSLMMGVTLMVIGLTLLFSRHLSDVIVDYDDTAIFLSLLFFVSTIGMVVIIALGHSNKLSNDEHYKDQRRTTFVRGGMTVLATGGIVYYAVELSSLARNYERCHQTALLVKAVLAILFTLLQVAFLLKYSQIRINRSLMVVTACRFMLMVIIAANSVVWLSVVIRETMEELYYQNQTTDGTASTIGYPHTDPITIRSLVKAQENCNGTIGHAISPFLFPLLIEFCVVSSTMTLAIWERCGVGMECVCNADAEPGTSCSSPWPRGRSMSTVSRVSSVDESVSNTEEEDGKLSGFYNTNLGFVCGWLTFVASIVSIFLVYTIDSAEGAIWLDYGTDLFLVVCGIIAVPLTVYKMSTMRFKDEQIRRQRKGERGLIRKTRLHRTMDRNLLTVTFLALLTYNMMSILVACYAEDGTILADAIASIVHGFMQTALINWYACHKRAKTPKERSEKPGRQLLEFLRMLNLSLWFVNTFLLKETHAKTLHQDIYGDETWVIISNILQPLTILYYFHSMVCIAEVIAKSYTHKYVGIPRPSKAAVFPVESKRQSATSYPDLSKRRRSLSSPDLSTLWEHI